MIPKSGNRLSDKIMREESPLKTITTTNQKARVHPPSPDFSWSFAAGQVFGPATQ